MPGLQQVRRQDDAEAGELAMNDEEENRISWLAKDGCLSGTQRGVLRRQALSAGHAQDEVDEETVRGLEAGRKCGAECAVEE